MFKFNDEIDKKLHQQVQTMKNKTYIQVFFIKIFKENFIFISFCRKYTANFTF